MHVKAHAVGLRFSHTHTHTHTHTHWIYKPLTEGCVHCKATLSNTLLRRAQLGRHTHCWSSSFSTFLLWSIQPHTHQHIQLEDKHLSDLTITPEMISLSVRDYKTLTLILSWWQVRLHPKNSVIIYPHVISNLFDYILSSFLPSFISKKPKTPKKPILKHACFNYIHLMKKKSK